MKVLVLSDIHGNIEYARLIPNIVDKEKPNNIVLLGDLFSYYGESDELIDIYNRYAGITIGIKGNNDSLYDINRLSFNMNNYSKMLINNRLFFFTHGHLYNKYTIPESVEIYVSGHTHIHEIVKENYLIMANPGSLGSPRDKIHSYMVIDDNYIYIKDIDGNILDSIEFAI